MKEYMLILLPEGNLNGGEYFNPYTPGASYYKINNNNAHIKLILNSLIKWPPVNMAIFSGNITKDSLCICAGQEIPLVTANGQGNFQTQSIFYSKQPIPESNIRFNFNGDCRYFKKITIGELVGNDSNYLQMKFFENRLFRLFIQTPPDMQIFNFNVQNVQNDNNHHNFFYNPIILKLHMDTDELRDIIHPPQNNQQPVPLHQAVHRFITSFSENNRFIIPLFDPKEETRYFFFNQVAGSDLQSRVATLFQSDFDDPGAPYFILDNTKLGSFRLENNNDTKYFYFDPPLNPCPSNSEYFIKFWVNKWGGEVNESHVDGYRPPRDNWYWMMNFTPTGIPVDDQSQIYKSCLNLVNLLLNHQENNVFLKRIKKIIDINTENWELSTIKELHQSSINVVMNNGHSYLSFKEKQFLDTFCRHALFPLSKVLAQFPGAENLIDNEKEDYQAFFNAHPYLILTDYIRFSARKFVRLLLIPLQAPDHTIKLTDRWWITWYQLLFSSTQKAKLFSNSSRFVLGGSHIGNGIIGTYSAVYKQPEELRFE